MEHISLREISRACGGTYYGDTSMLDTEISGVAIDSRKIEPGFLFIPIRGEREDGHRFIPEVIKQGASCTLSENLMPESVHPYILVASCRQALRDLAEYYRRSMDIKVIGVTGSVGKTSTKDMIASVLEQRYRVLKTAGNYNNEIGLPLTIFNLRKEHQVAVLEMGISDFGEMERLAKVARPDICVITNIGYSHIEYLKSREGILKAKTEMFDYKKPGGFILLNGDDDMLSSVTESHGTVPMFFGLDQNREIYASEIEELGLKGTRCMIHLPVGEFPVFIAIPGTHMVYNALAAAAAGYVLGLTPEEIKAGIEHQQSAAGRNHLIETTDLTVIDDCYNANPVSVKASLEILSYAKGRKVAVLGDMGELGKKEGALHREVGAYAADMGIDCLYGIGDLASEYIAGAADGKCCTKHFDTKEAFMAHAAEYIQKGDTVLIKASHFMGFSEIVEALTRGE